MKIKISQTANIYAEALSKIDADKNIIKNDFYQVISTITFELMTVFNNPTIPTDKKLEILKEVFENKINQKLYDFLKILVEKNRISLINEIYESYTQTINSENNIQTVEVTSAIELDNSYKDKIINKLKEKTKKEIQAEWITDKSIIAGLIIKIGDTVIDSSLKNKIDKLKKQL